MQGIEQELEVFQGGGWGMLGECSCKHVHLQGSVLECTLPCFCHETEIQCSRHAGGVHVQAWSLAGECVGMHAPLLPRN